MKFTGVFVLALFSLVASIDSAQAIEVNCQSTQPEATLNFTYVNDNFEFKLTGINDEGKRFSLDSTYLGVACLADDSGVDSFTCEKNTWDGDGYKNQYYYFSKSWTSTPDSLNYDVEVRRTTTIHDGEEFGEDSHVPPYAFTHCSVLP